MFGIGVESDSGIVGTLTFQETLKDSEIRQIFGIEPDGKSQGVTFKQHNFRLQAEKVALGNSSNIFLFECNIHARCGSSWVQIQAEKVLLDFPARVDFLSEKPDRLQALGNVRYHFRCLPQADPIFFTGDELNWDLIEDKIELRNASQIIQIQNLIAESDSEASRQKPQSPPETRSSEEWNQLHELALDKTVKVEGNGLSLFQELQELGRRHFNDKLIFDENELKKSGISLP